MAQANDLGELVDDSLTCVVPHRLRHTCTIQPMQAGVDKWEASGFLGMTIEMPDRVHGRRAPNHPATHQRPATERPRQIVGGANEGQLSRSR